MTGSPYLAGIACLDDIEKTHFTPGRGICKRKGVVTQFIDRIFNKLFTVETLRRVRYARSVVVDTTESCRNSFSRRLSVSAVKKDAAALECCRKNFSKRL